MKRATLRTAAGVIGVSILACAGWVAYAATACNTHTHLALRGSRDYGSQEHAIQIAGILASAARSNHATGQTIEVHNRTVDYSIDFANEDPVLPDDFEAQRVPDEWAAQMRTSSIIILVNLMLMLAAVLSIARYYSRPEAWVMPPQTSEDDTYGEQ